MALERGDVWKRMDQDPHRLRERVRALERSRPRVYAVPAPRTRVARGLYWLALRVDRHPRA